MSNQPEQPHGGIEYPPIEQHPHADPFAPVDYPADYPPLPPPVYPQPGGDYPPPYPGYPPAHPSPYAGYPPYPYDPYQTGRPPGTNGKAIASLVTSLAGLLCCGLPAIVGLVLGVVAMRETKSTGQDGYGLAVAGVIIGALVISFLVIYILVAVVIGASGWSTG